MTSYISGEKFIRWNKTDFIHTTVQLSQRLVCVILVLSTFLIYLYWLHQLKYHIYTLIRSVSIYSLITLRSWNVTKQSLINFFLQKFEGDVRTNVIIHLYVTVENYINMTVAAYGANLDYDHFGVVPFPFFFLQHRLMIVLTNFTWNELNFRHCLPFRFWVVFLCSY